VRAFLHARRLGREAVAGLLVLASASSAQEPIERSFEASDAGYGFRMPGFVPALRSFDIGYRRGDRHVHMLFVGPLTDAPIESGDFVGALRDADGGDAISGAVKLTDLRRLGSHREVVRRDCTGECRLRIPHLIGTEAFVLTGFGFRRDRGDRHVLQVKVRQAAHNGYIDVKLVDNSGTGTYFAHVTYAVIPRARLEPYLVQARSGGPARGEASVARSPGQALLQSFDLRFLNGDHHLQRIGVDLTGDRLLVRFRDQNGDDPFEWHVEYSILR
jgi:hypothetical protein